MKRLAQIAIVVMAWPSLACAQQNLASLDSQAPGAQPASGFSTMPRVEHAGNSFKIGPEHNESFGLPQEGNETFRPLTRGDRPISLGRSTQPRYFQDADMAGMTQHDIWPTQAWTLVEHMPWPPGAIALSAYRALPVIRVTDPSAAVQVILTPTRPAAQNMPPPGMPSQGNDPVMPPAGQPPPKMPTNADGVPMSGGPNAVQNLRGVAVPVPQKIN